MKKLIIITSSLHPPVADYQKLCIEELQKKNTVVLVQLHIMDHSGFFKSLHKKKTYLSFQDGYFIFHPINFLPFMRFSVIRKCNSFIDLLVLQLLLILKRKISLQTPSILWLQTPFDFTDYPRQLIQFTHRSVYDCIDNFTGVFFEQEKELLQQVNFLFTNSHVLEKKFKKLGRHPILVPLGCRIKTGPSPASSVTFPHKKSLIGYVGGVSNRLDYELLGKLVKQNQQWNFVIWGPVYTTKENIRLTKKLFSNKNVIHGESPGNQIFNIINQFDVAIIPYEPDNLFNRYCYPFKAMEYFYCGKPIISSQIIELQRFPRYIKIAETVSTWESAITDWLTHTFSKKELGNLKKIALNNSWEKKISRIEKYLDARI